MGRGAQYFKTILENIADRDFDIDIILDGCDKGCTRARGNCTQDCVKTVSPLDDTDKADLRSIFWLYGDETLPRVFNGQCRRYQQDRPKDRVIAAINDAINRGA